MKRRELIKLVTLGSGAVLTTPILSSLFTSCKEAAKTPDADYNLQFFNKEDFLILKTILDTILPKTDSPSATEAGVHKMMDTMIGTVYKPSDREKYKQKFETLKDYLQATSLQLSEALQHLSKSADKNDRAAKRVMLELKQQTISYYLSTEFVAKNYLNYLPVPGKYEPCISLEETGGKRWAL